MAPVDALPHCLTGNAEAFSDLSVFHIALTDTEVASVMAFKCRQLLWRQVLRSSLSLLLITVPTANGCNRCLNANRGIREQIPHCRIVTVFSHWRLQ